ncbi:hypothetical protein NPIL_80841 [Nephila pilipes]|uniref:Uncharacterized protein n=1 Tax=Nephila pilipes TaxID=299642 RepID=A0A8X6IEH3_NEPPI|nr:hypothetical protein NPIL_80841 [Nephila pilipes]
MKDVQRLVTQGPENREEGERIRLVLPRAIQHSSPSPPSFLVVMVTGGMREHRVTGDRSVESKYTFAWKCHPKRTETECCQWETTHEYLSFFTNIGTWSCIKRHRNKPLRKRLLFTVATIFHDDKFLHETLDTLNNSKQTILFLLHPRFPSCGIESFRGKKTTKLYLPFRNVYVGTVLTTFHFAWMLDRGVERQIRGEKGLRIDQLSPAVELMTMHGIGEKVFLAEFVMSSDILTSYAASHCLTTLPLLRAPSMWFRFHKRCLGMRLGIILRDLPACCLYNCSLSTSDVMF